MSDDLVIYLYVFCPMAVVGIVWWVAHEVRKGPRKQNKRIIRVPRETLWTRTNRYHGVKQ